VELFSVISSELISGAVSLGASRLEQAIAAFERAEALAELSDSDYNSWIALHQKPRLCESDDLQNQRQFHEEAGRRLEVVVRGRHVEKPPTSILAAT
jgi:hypothetical protein